MGETVTEWVEVERPLQVREWVGRLSSCEAEEEAEADQLEGRLSSAEAEEAAAEE